MSLSSLLLGTAVKAKVVVDNDLDALFQSNPAPPPPPKPVSSSKQTATPIAIPSNLPIDQRGQKRKREPDNKPKPSNSESPVKSPSKKQKAESVKPNTKVAKKPTKDVTRKADTSDENEDQDDAQIEENYLARRTSGPKQPPSQKKAGSSSEDEDDSDTSPPAHETQKTSKWKLKHPKKSKYVPPGETSAQKDARTVFIGNVPIEAVKSKPLQKQLKRHLLNLIPEAKIESMRFRSVAFAAPTANTDEPSTKEKRQLERAADWRETGGPEEKEKKKQKVRAEDETSDIEDTQRKPRHIALTPAERKRVAFIKQDFHQEADVVNAYIVFAHSQPRDEAVAPATGIKFMHPAEAARLAAERADGTVFSNRTIRVDRVGQWRTGLPEDLVADAQVTGDPRATLFVGNLDFAAKEEELRVWFEGVVSKERGPPPDDSESEDESPEEDEVEEKGKGPQPKKPKSWVKSVRIVRDKDTQLGKGFAYVRFIDRECVDELLNLEPSTLKFAKRRLRVSRCKGIPGATPKTTAPKPTKASTAKGNAGKSDPKVRRQQKSAPIVVPKGDPTLGAKLAGLSKDERKAAKAEDVARVQRRLAKKKAKAATGLNKSSAEKVGRDRERKRHGDKAKQNFKTKTKAKPGRVRSEKSVEKRNAKK